MGLSGRRGLNACGEDADVAGTVMSVEEAGSMGVSGLGQFWLLADCAAEQAATVKVTVLLGTVVMPVTKNPDTTHMAKTTCIVTAHIIYT